MILSVESGYRNIDVCNKRGEKALDDDIKYQILMVLEKSVGEIVQKNQSNLRIGSNTYSSST